MIKSLEKENILDAVRIFEEEPILNYQTESPVFRLNYFEFSNKTNKNPVFLRILLNYISLINVLYDKKFLKFHEILLKFHAKFTYEELENQNIKLILLVKSNAAVYNMIFKEGVNIFPNRNDIDINFWNKNEEDIGYTFQELGRTFINDYVIGRDKGIELPNMVFYIRSIEEIHKLIGKLFIIPVQLKLDLNENCEHCGVNEYDHVIEMTQDLTIDKNNPYFRYIKNAEGLNVQSEFLAFEKNKILFWNLNIPIKEKTKKTEWRI